MRKQRRGSTDLEWINKYQHSDHHVDRQTRKMLENISGEFPVGLPPAPNHRLSSFYSPATTRKLNSINNYGDVDAIGFKASRLGLPPINRYKTKQFPDEDTSSYVDYRLRSNSLSTPPTIMDRNRRHSLVGLGRPSMIASSSTPASRRGSISVVANNKRGSVVDYLSPSVDHRGWRAMSVPSRTEPAGGYYNFHSRGRNGSAGVAGTRFSYAAPSYSLYGDSKMKRDSITVGANGSGDFNRRLSLYNNINNLKYNICNNNNNGGFPRTHRRNFSCSPVISDYSLHYGGLNGNRY